MSIVGLLIFAIVIAGILAVLRAVGVAIPANVEHILWIVLVVIIAVWAVKYLAAML